MGTPEFAVPALAALIERCPQAEVVGVFTQPDRPAGRGRELTAPPVKELATHHGIPVFQPTKMRTDETRELLLRLAPELVVVAAYGRILPKQLLEVAPRGCVNLHASLLPRHRGASPIQHAIWLGDVETGVSLMQMDEGLDTGAVLATKKLPIAANATSTTLSAELATLAAQLLTEKLDALLAGELTPRPQDSALATYARLLTKDDGRLDFTKPAVELERQVRALDAWPQAFIERGSDRIQVSAAHVVAAHGSPGEVVQANAQGVVVACGQGALALDEVKPPGKRMMPAAAWVNGRGIAVGDRVGRDS